MVDEAQVAVAASLPRVRDPQFREVYSNVSLTMLGGFDITLLFQKQTEIAPGQSVVMDQVAVILAPQHFKALIRSLNETLTAYEKVFGALTIPDADTAPRKSAEEIEKIVRGARDRAQKR
jgi:hypothetical protein